MKWLDAPYYLIRKSIIRKDDYIILTERTDTTNWWAFLGSDSLLKAKKFKTKRKAEDYINKYWDKDRWGFMVVSRMKLLELTKKGR